MPSITDLIETWRAPDDILDVLPQIASAAVTRIANADIDDDPDLVEVNDLPSSAGGKALTFVHCESVIAHVDQYFDPWIMLVVLQAAPGHRIGLAAFKPKQEHNAPNYPASTPTIEIPVSAGDIVLMNDHHTHWLTAAQDGSRFIALNLDLPCRYTQDEANTKLRQTLTKHGSLIVAAATDTNAE